METGRLLFPLLLFSFSLSLYAQDHTSIQYDLDSIHQEAINNSDSFHPLTVFNTPDDQYWDDRFRAQGFADGVKVIEVFGNEIYAGGWFWNVGEIQMNRIAHWDGDEWRPVGRGVNGRVEAIRYDGEYLYVGGYFTEAYNDDGARVPVNYIARWSGSEWTSIGNGTGGPVFAIELTDTGLIAGGSFSTVNTDNGEAVTVNNVALWDGNIWHAMSNGVQGGVYSIARSDSGGLYIGGDFKYTMRDEDQIELNYIAQWSNGQWTPLAGGVRGYTPTRVTIIRIFHELVYIAGMITEAYNNDGTAEAISGLLMWDGTNWHAPGGRVRNVVSAITEYRDHIVIAGDIVSVAGERVGNVLKLGEAGWHTVGNARFNGMIYSIHSTGSDLLAGGDFTSTGQSGASNFARWNEISWNDIITLEHPSPNAFIRSMSASDGNLYVGGEFAAIGTNNSLSLIAGWDGNEWFSLGSGAMGHGVYAVAARNSEVFIGGNVGAADGIRTYFLAHWDGVRWSDVGGGVNATVSEVSVDDTFLYAAGSFTHAGWDTDNQVPVNRFARWDGISWTNIVNRVRGPWIHRIETIVPHDNKIYVGGYFDQAHMASDWWIEVNNIALWDNNQWNALGRGLFGFEHPAVSGIVYTIALDENENVYAGGIFQYAGNTENESLEVNNIARWTGTEWEAIGMGVNGTVYKIIVREETVYVGGTFSVAYNSYEDSVVVNRVAKWHDGQWHALGSGVNGAVFDMAFLGDDLYLGGAFNRAGGKSSQYFARWSGEIFTSVQDKPMIPITFTVSQNYPNPFNPSTTIRYELPVQSSVKVEIFNTLGQILSSPLDDTKEAGSHELIINLGHLPSGVYFYRLQATPSDNGAGFKTYTQTKPLVLVK